MAEVRGSRQDKYKENQELAIAFSNEAVIGHFDQNSFDGALGARPDGVM